LLHADLQKEKQKFLRSFLLLYFLRQLLIFLLQCIYKTIITVGLFLSSKILDKTAYNNRLELKNL